jgi:hypothetical protein
VAARGGLAEMAGFVERDEEFQLLDVHLRSRVGEGEDSIVRGEAASLVGLSPQVTGVV